MSSSEQRFLIFFMHGRHYAFDLALVAEVMDPVVCWPIPFVPPCYTGAINFHGAIVSVIDLAVFLGFACCPGQGKIIVLDVNIASLGILVESVARIVPKLGLELRKAPDVPFASASLCLPEGNAALLDIAAIVEEAKNSINL